METKIALYIFDVNELKSKKINKKKIFGKFNYLKKHTLQSIKSAQKQATRTYLRPKKIPFRSFEIYEKMKRHLVKFLLSLRQFF